MSYDHSLPVAHAHATSSVRNLIELCDCLNNPHRVTDECGTGSISVVHDEFPAKRVDALFGASVRLVVMHNFMSTCRVCHTQNILWMSVTVTWAPKHSRGSCAHCLFRNWTECRLASWAENASQHEKHQASLLRRPWLQASNKVPPGPRHCTSPSKLNFWHHP